jgi:hypothetical protein
MTILIIISMDNLNIMQILVICIQAHKIIDILNKIYNHHIIMRQII